MAGAQDGPDLVFEDGIVGAAQDQGVHALKGGQVAAQDQAGAFPLLLAALDDGHQERTGLLDDRNLRVQFLQLQIEGLGDHGALGGDHPDALVAGPGHGLFHRGDQHPQDPEAGVAFRQPDLLDAPQGPGRGGVAGQDDEAAALAEEIIHRLLGEADHHPVAPGAVGDAGIVPQVEIVILRQDLQKFS